MKFAAHTLFAVAVIVLLVPFLNGQQADLSSAGATSQAASDFNPYTSCPHLFTAGTSTSNTFLQYCVTDHGNISSIQTPFGHLHLGAQGDGYSFCQESPATEYHDYLAGDSANWNAPQILSLSGSAIKISRTTSDGNWTLVQTISKVAATGSIKIVMALTNNQSVDKVAYLVRFADVDPNGMKNTGNIAGASLQSAFAWDRTLNTFHFGLQLQNVGKWSGYQQGFVQGIPLGPNACAWAYYAAAGGMVFDTDLSLIYAYVNVVPAHGTVTATLTYRGT